MLALSYHNKSRQPCLANASRHLSSRLKKLQAMAAQFTMEIWYNTQQKRVCNPGYSSRRDQDDYRKDASRKPRKAVCRQARCRSCAGIRSHRSRRRFFARRLLRIFGESSTNACGATRRRERAARHRLPDCTLSRMERLCPRFAALRSSAWISCAHRLGSAGRERKSLAFRI